MLPKTYPLKKTCSVEGCESIHLAKGFCNKHYKRFQTYGDPLGRHDSWDNVKVNCEFNGCGRPHVARGFCNGHHRQFMEGKMLVPLSGRSISPDERFDQKVSKGQSCWQWEGSLSKKGYGNFFYDGKVGKAHRYAYERFIGPIPDGMFIDHICRNKSCVNPSHLRVVTNKQNSENHNGLRSDNTTSVRGVFWNNKKNKLWARVTHHGRDYYLGRFESLEEAEKAVIAKRNELFTHNDIDRR